MDDLPLHLLPPHIKLSILSKLDAQNVSTSASQSSNKSSTTPLFTLSDQSLPSPATAELMKQLLQDGYCVFDDFLKSASQPSDPSIDFPSAFNHEIESLLSSGTLKPMAMRSGNTDMKWSAPDVRGDLALWLNEQNSYEQPTIQSIICAINQFMTRLGDVISDFPHTPSGSSQLAVYDGGDSRYVRHSDTFEGGPQRKLTVIWYANSKWQPEHGGKLRIFKQAGDGTEAHIDIEPLFDRLLIFDSVRMDHEVMPSKARRAALTTWFK